MWLCFELCDHGSGIDEADLDRVFSRSSTTKINRYDFGLHSCANASKQRGGTLASWGDGVGTEPRFVLWLARQHPD